MQPERDEWELRWTAFEAAKADWEAHDADVALAARVAVALTVPAPVLFIPQTSLAIGGSYFVSNRIRSVEQDFRSQTPQHLSGRRLLA